MAKNAVKYKLLTIGGSAGSLDAILKIVSGLPLKSNISVVIIVHRKNDGESILTTLLTDRTDFTVKEVEDKESIEGGNIYIAPPDYHLLIENEKMFSLDSSEKIHHSRPSIDVSFESIADTFKQLVIGVLLSGANADGAEGLKKIKEAGGFTIVQDPATADVGFMPQVAIDEMQPDKILDKEDMSAFINSLLE